MYSGTKFRMLQKYRTSDRDQEGRCVLLKLLLLPGHPCLQFCIPPDLPVPIPISHPSSAFSVSPANQRTIPLPPGSLQTSCSHSLKPQVRASPGAVECSEHWANVSHNILTMVFPGPKRWFCLESPQDVFASSFLYASLSEKS